MHRIFFSALRARLAKRREILIFPRTAGNTGNSWELLVIPGNYWEISYSLIKKLLILLLIAIQLYLECKNNHYNSTFYQIIKYICFHAVTLLFLYELSKEEPACSLISVCQ